MRDARVVLVFVFADQTSTLDDKTTALALAQACAAEVAQIAAAMGKTRGKPYEWATRDSNPQPPRCKRGALTN